MHVNIKQFHRHMKWVWLRTLLTIGMLAQGCYHPTFRKDDSDANVTSTSSSTSLTIGTEHGPLTEGMSEGGLSGMTSSMTASSGEENTSDANPGVCGDENVDPGESCDDGKNNGQEGLCREDCTICGDGIVQVDVEECDDGGLSVSCDSDCTWVVCGDGVINQAAGEDCEGGESPVCNANCTASVCGDGVLNLSAGELCDDGNNARYDGCELDCQPTPFGVISAGEGNSCVLLGNGKIRCWGRGGSGQLGYGSTENVGDDELPYQKGPVDVDGIAKQIATSGNHTCAMLIDGDVHCWGSGGTGALGHGNANSIGHSMESLSALKESVVLGGQAIQIAAGGSHTCALLAGEDGSIRCWGYGNYGRLGYSSNANVGDKLNTLPSMQEPVKFEGAAIQITAGSQHTCALLENGDVYCWGYGRFGLLGYANTGGIKCLNKANSFSCSQNDHDNIQHKECCIGDDEYPVAVAEPIDVGGKAIQIAAGLNHTCAILAGEQGNVVCWGQAYYGQLGYGNTGNNLCPDQFVCSNPTCCIGDDETPASAGVVDLGGKAAVQIAAGGFHTCALLNDGSVRCWGNNAYGQLGYGHSNTIGDDEKPSAEVMPVKLEGKVLQVAAGFYHTCALVEGGNMYCWGQGYNYGELGYGNTSGNICKIDNVPSCLANSFCCIGDKQGEMPPAFVEYKE